MSSKAPLVAVDAAILIDQIDGVFPAADAARAAAFSNLSAVRTARMNVLQRVRDRLPPNAPEVAALDEQLAEGRALASKLAALGGLAAKPPVTAGELETVAHGFVCDAAGHGVAGVRIALAVPKGEALDTVTTGTDGHFVLRTSAATKLEIPSTVELRVLDNRHPSSVTLERGRTGVVFTTVRLEA
jgi:hypothetical protein